MLKSRTDDIDVTLFALSDPARRLVIDLLSEGPRPAGELAEHIEMSGPATSRHLRILRKSGLVDEQRDDEDARIRMYHLVPDRFEDLQSWLNEIKRFWTDQLQAFKEHVEKTATSDDRKAKADD